MNAHLRCRGRYHHQATDVFARGGGRFRIQRILSEGVFLVINKSKNPVKAYAWLIYTMFLKYINSVKVILRMSECTSKNKERRAVIRHKEGVDVWGGVMLCGFLLHVCISFLQISKPAALFYTNRPVLMRALLVVAVKYQSIGVKNLNNTKRERSCSWTTKTLQLSS